MPALVRRNPARHKPHLIEAQRLLCQPGQLHMAEMDRIKGPAKHCDFPGFRHGVAHGTITMLANAPISRSVGKAASRILPVTGSKTLTLAVTADWALA